MSNRKKSAPISMFVMIAVIGLVISFVNGDFNGLGAMFEELDTGTLYTLVDVINIGLGFLALAGVFIFFFVRAAKGGREKNLDFDQDIFKEDQ